MDPAWNESACVLYLLRCITVGTHIWIWSESVLHALALVLTRHTKRQPLACMHYQNKVWSQLKQHRFEHSPCLLYPVQRVNQACWSAAQCSWCHTSKAVRATSRYTRVLGLSPYSRDRSIEVGCIKRLKARRTRTTLRGLNLVSPAG